MDFLCFKTSHNKLPETERKTSVRKTETLLQMFYHISARETTFMTVAFSNIIPVELEFIAMSY